MNWPRDTRTPQQVLQDADEMISGKDRLQPGDRLPPPLEKLEVLDSGSFHAGYMKMYEGGRALRDGESCPCGCGAIGGLREPPPVRHVVVRGRSP